METHSHRFIFILALVLLPLGCVSTPPIVQKTPRPRIALSQPSQDLVNIYSKGVNEILQDINEQKDFDSQTLRPALSAWENTTWIEVDRENMITAATDSSANPILVAVFAPDNPRLQKAGPTIQTVFGEKFTTIEIRPSNLTSPWGGVFLLHELSMAAGNSSVPIEINQLKASLTAYSAMNRVVGKELRPMLDESLDNLKIKHPTHLNLLWKKKSPELTDELASLDTKITKIAPAGTDDSDLRTKLEFSYLLIRYYEKQGWLNLTTKSKVTQELGDAILKLNL